MKNLRLVPATAAVVAFASLAPPAAGQAFTPPQGVGAVTVAWQYVNNTGHRLSDGFFVERGQSVTTSVDLELEYGFTDRLSATLGIPYVWAKYTGAQPPPSGLPVDTCGCWHSGFQDYTLSARYRFGHEPWAVTPLLRYVLPSHDYKYQGEAVVGRNLQELQVGVAAALRLTAFLPQASVGAGYTYAFVERAIPGVSIDRSNGYVEIGYALTRRLYVREIGIWQRTHGGLRFGSPTGDPFFPPGELNTPARIQQRDRLLRTNYWQAGGGLAYSTGPFDVFASVVGYVWGRDAHAGQSYTVGATWYFGGETN
ncbi:MAG TPA: hypothetical protein VKF32_13310 [Thermoanaerobaculia bacterium]|nr:hypothetical protein [Thermoanaerobaculia bacterium]